MELPLLVDNILTEEDIRIIMNYIESTEESDWMDNGSDNPHNKTIDVHSGENMNRQGEDYWAGRTIHLPKIKSKNTQVADIMKRWAHGIRKKAVEHFKLKHLICDGPHLVRWLHGYELFPHCDQEEPDGREHEFPYRDFGSITWLNNNYTGGQIYYPNLDNYSPEMKVGRTAFHRGTCNHMHGVKEVDSGIRYTIASFWSARENPPQRVMEIAKEWDMNNEDKIIFKRTKPIPFNRR